MNDKFTQRAKSIVDLTSNIFNNKLDIGTDTPTTEEEMEILNIIFSGCPIPMITMREISDKEDCLKFRYKLINGNKILHTLFDFVSDKICYSNLKYSELPENLKINFSSTVIQINVVKEDCSRDFCRNCNKIIKYV